MVSLWGAIAAHEDLPPWDHLRRCRRERAPTEIPMLIGGEWRPGSETYEVRDPYRGSVVSRAPRSSARDLDDALNAAVAAKAGAAASPAYERAALLRRAGMLLVERADRIAEIMTRETGKAIKDAKAEIVRSQDTLSLSAEEAVRIEGEHVPLDATAMGAGKICFMLRFPVGVVAAITPFNAPVNLACHKIAPAIAAGNTLVLKAPPQSPGVIHELARIFVDAGTPPGVLNVLYGETVGPALVRDPQGRLRDLHRLHAGGRRDQGRLRTAPRRARARGHRHHHRARGCRHRGSRTDMRAQCDAVGRPELHLGADGACPSQAVRALRGNSGRRGEDAQARRPVGPRHRCRHTYRRGSGAARRGMDRPGGRGRCQAPQRRQAPRSADRAHGAG